MCLRFLLGGGDGSGEKGVWGTISKLLGLVKDGLTNSLIVVTVLPLFVVGSGEMVFPAKSLLPACQGGVLDAGGPDGRSF
jgi:hypothetical protein